MLLLPLMNKPIRGSPPSTFFHRVPVQLTRRSSIVTGSVSPTEGICSRQPCQFIDRVSCVTVCACLRVSLAERWSLRDGFVMDQPLRDPGPCLCPSVTSSLPLRSSLTSFLRSSLASSFPSIPPLRLSPSFLFLPPPFYSHPYSRPPPASSPPLYPLYCIRRFSRGKPCSVLRRCAGHGGRRPSVAVRLRL